MNLDSSQLPKLPPGWTYSPLGDLVDDRGICYGVVQPGQHDPNGIPIIRVNNLKENQIITNDVMKISSTIEAKYGRSRLKGGEVLLSLVGTLGQVAVVPNSMEGWNTARAVGVIPIRKEFDNRWVALCLRSSYAQHFMQMWANTTVQATLNLKDVTQLPVPIPPKKQAQFLAEKASLFDNKITSNNQINETLESIAKAIFKEWFIDFGPVKAKAEGKKPFGMDYETARLFPDDFEDSELGPIPRGWNVSTYSSIMEHIKESVKPEGFGQIECLHYSLPNFDTGRNAKTENVAEIKSNKFRVHHSSILFSKLNPRTPRVWIANHNESENQMAICSTEFVVIQPSKPENRWLTYCLLSESTFLDRMSQAATGTSNSHQRIKPEFIFETKWATPNEEIIERFGKAVKSLFELSLNNLKEIQYLTQTRDLLLPKLISGEIDLLRELP